MWPSYHMFFRKQCWHLKSEWTLGLMNALKYHWCETSLFLSQVVLKHWCPKTSSSRSLRKGLVLYPTKIEQIYSIVPYQKFHVTLATLKRKLQHVGHKWVGINLSQGVLKYWCPKTSSSRSLPKGLVLYAKIGQIYSIVPYQSFMSH